MSKWLAVAVVVVLGAGCKYGAGAFTCGPDKPCGGSGICEPGFNLCSFPDEANCGAGGRSFGDLAGDKSGDCVGGKGSGDGGIDSPPDAQTCFGTGLLHICLAEPPTMPLTISDPTTIDTTNSPMCATVISGGDYCVLGATAITIDAQLRATGSRPLVLIATESITTGALIDVGSHRGANLERGAGADPTTCGPGTAPGTGGGGAGGSFTGLGGEAGGGAGGGAGGLPGTVAPINLRGGCAGQDGDGAGKGTGGHGGGAVFLIAGNTISLGGGINAAGEGGNPGMNNTSGGGGGGAGGMIGFDAPAITSIGNPLLLANGGGGGEGSGENSPGNVGADPSGISAAIGGNGGLSNGGDGGNGSSGTVAGPGAIGSAGTVVSSKAGGGGGGGGGAGLVKAPATASLGTNVSPPATP